MKPLLVVNPRSGGGKTGETWSELLKVIERKLGDVDVAMTERPGHGIDLAKAGANEGRELVVAVGGDGTINEVVNGLVHTKARLGVIGQGTGGDFRRTLGIEHRLDAYLDALASGKERPIDVGRASFTANDGARAERYFVNILSSGMSGLVDRLVADASRAFGGTAAYFGASLRALLRAKNARITCAVTLDGKTQEKKIQTFVIAICNGQYFGAGMQVAPMAVIDDGRFEVVTMTAGSKLSLALKGQKMYSGSHLGQDGFDHFACDKLTLALEDDDARDVFLLDVDGEPLGRPPLEIELLKGAVTLRA